MARRSKHQADELRGLSNEDLTKELDETYRELFTARLQLSTRQQANTSIARKLRRRIARIKTLQHERDLAARYQAATAE
jgi:large subunit ribosomal protein L29